MKNTEEKKCSICGDNYRGFGNNAEPFQGICCDNCNEAIVIPARINQLVNKYQKTI